MRFLLANAGALDYVGAMHRIASMVALAACSSTSASDSAKPTIAASGCPVISGAEERFAVGAVADHGVADMRADHGNLCHDTFAPNAVLVMKDGQPTVTGEGTFTGTCKESPSERTYAAIRPARLAVDVNGLAVSDGALGRDKPLTLDSKTPDKTAWVHLVLLDRCGEELSAGASQDKPTTSGCDNVVKLRWSTEMIRPREIEVVAVAPGTCTLDVSYLGATGKIVITVR